MLLTTRMGKLSLMLSTPALYVDYLHTLRFVLGKGEAYSETRKWEEAAAEAAVAVTVTVSVTE